MPVRKEYVYASPVVQTQTNRAEIVKVEIDPRSDAVRLIVEKRFDGTVTGMEVVSLTMAALDTFIDNAASFEGSGVLEKVLRYFAQVGILPAGGTVQEPS